MKQKKWLISGLVVLGSVAACSNEESSLKETETSSNLTKLAGVYSSGCIVDSGFSQKSIHEIDQKGMRIDAVLYKDLDCKNKSVTATVFIKINKLQALENEQMVFQMDTELYSDSLTVHSPEMIENYNTAKFYGQDDWKINEPKSTLGIRAVAKESDPDAKVSKKGEKGFGMIKLVDNKKLCFAEESEELDGLSVEKRSTVFGQEADCLIKQ